MGVKERFRTMILYRNSLLHFSSLVIIIQIIQKQIKKIPFIFISFISPLLMKCDMPEIVK